MKNPSMVPEITSDIEQRIKNALIKQYEDQYGVKIISYQEIFRDKEPAYLEGV